jgi:hypothetical protein
MGPDPLRVQATQDGEQLSTIVRWFLKGPYRLLDGSVAPPFYCDPKCVGAFAVIPEELAAGHNVAVFKLLVALAMYQALRDVVIMGQQRLMPHADVRVLADVGFLGQSVATHRCPKLLSPEAFKAGCDVSKRGKLVDCGSYPGAPCHVKRATVAFNRMGDMGKLPTSAWFLLGKDGGLQRVLDQVHRQSPSPTKRAELLVTRIAQIHRVGRKLATMFVSALATPALAPGLTPWFPEVDGNQLVVVDTNVARAVDALRGAGAPKTYDSREHWVREAAALIDLRRLRPDLPQCSPRLVQQALYSYCSKSNRVARMDPCAQAASTCEACVVALCPVRARSAAYERKSDSPAHLFIG